MLQYVTAETLTRPAYGHNQPVTAETLTIVPHADTPPPGASNHWTRIDQ